LVGILATVLMRPIGLSPIVGHLVAGLVIGPHALGLVPEAAGHICSAGVLGLQGCA
jgi:K+:H+ antiporter